MISSFKVFMKYSSWYMSPNWLQFFIKYYINCWVIQLKSHTVKEGVWRQIVLQIEILIIEETIELLNHITQLLMYYFFIIHIQINRSEQTDESFYYIKWRKQNLYKWKFSAKHIVPWILPYVTVKKFWND